jgi:hypothetical protein
MATQKPHAVCNDVTKALFLVEYRRHGSMAQACREAGIGSRQTIHNWMDADAAFAAEVADAKEDVIDGLEFTLYQVATGQLEFSSPQVTALIFSLKGNRPEKYRDRYELTGKDGGPVEVKTIEVVKDYGSATVP